MRGAPGAGVVLSSLAVLVPTVVAEAELLARNDRDETVLLQVRRRVRGELREATHTPRVERLATADRSLDPLHELVWEIQVAPRDEVRLRYRHELLVPH